jgi:hypothetical protein
VDQQCPGYSWRLDIEITSPALRRIRVLTVFSPFIDGFSPFSTVFSASGNRESFGTSSACGRAPFFAPLKNGENGENDQTSL